MYLQKNLKNFFDYDLHFTVKKLLVSGTNVKLILVSLKVEYLQYAFIYAICEKNA